MLRACLDTNVWLSGTIFSGPPAAVVNLAYKKKFHVIISTVILDEFEKNLITKFDVLERKARKLRYEISQFADIFEPSGSVKIITRKHSDNLVLETALLGKAKYLVTGDHKDLLPLKTFKNIKIIEPATFLTLFHS